MANSWAASLPTVGANNGGNVTLTFSNFIDAASAAYTLVQGDIVVVAYASSGTADLAMAATWSGGVGDSIKIGEHYSNGTIDTNVAVFAKTMGASPDASVIVTGPTGNSNATIAVAHVLKGTDISVVDVATVTAAGTATSVPDPGQITPSTAGAFIGVVGAGAAAAGATFTNSDLNSTTNHWRTGNHPETNDIAIGFGWKEDWSSGAFNPAVWGGGNANASNSWAALTFALKPAPVIATGTLATTEAADTASLAGDILVQGSIGATEGADTAALSGIVLVQGSLSASESGADTFAAAGTIGDSAVTGTLAATEAADTAALAGGVLVQGALAATDDSDTAAFAGDVLVLGSLAGTEGADVAAFAGAVLVLGLLNAAEASDVASIAGDVLVVGTLAATEGATDTAIFLGGNVPITGTLAANENSDTASLGGQVIVGGALDASEAADTGSIVGRILVSGSIGAIEAANDIFSASGREPIAAPAARTTFAPPRAGRTSTDDMGNSASPARTHTVSATRMRA